MPLRCLLLLVLSIPACAADVLVQAAIAEELQPLLAALENRQQVQVAAWTYWTGRMGRKSVVVSRTDVGPLNAAAATALGIERFHPAAVINQGTAGASNPGLRLWDIVVGERTTDYSAFRAAHGDRGSGMNPARWTPLPHSLRLNGGNLTPFPHFPGDARLVAAALRVKYDRGRVLRGNIGTAFQYNRELDRMDWLHRTYGIDTEDMESAYAAGVATAMQVPFLAVRIVSDSEWNHPRFERSAGEHCARFVIDLIRSLP